MRELTENNQLFAKGSYILFKNNHTSITFLNN